MILDLRWSLNLITGTFIRRGKDKERHRGHMKTEAETRVTLPEAKGCLEPPEATTGKERSPEDFRGITAQLTL